MPRSPTDDAARCILSRDGLVDRLRQDPDHVRLGRPIRAAQPTVDVVKRHPRNRSSIRYLFLTLQNIKGDDMACAICSAGNHNSTTCPQVRRCSGCGKRGHNIQTCPDARRCSVCGSYKHDRRTCPQR